MYVWNGRGRVSFFDNPPPSRGASEQPPTTHPPTHHSPPITHHPPPTTHYPLQESNSAAVRRAIYLAGEKQPVRWLLLFSCWVGLPIVDDSPPRREPSEPSPGGRLRRSPLAELGHRRPFIRRHVIRMMYAWDVAAPRGRVRPSGARESQLFFGHVITKICAKILLDIITPMTLLIAYYITRTTAVVVMLQLPCCAVLLYGTC